eukprot:gene25114-10755_t
MQSRKDLAAAGKKKLEEFRKAKLAGKGGSGAAKTKAEGPTAPLPVREICVTQQPPPGSPPPQAAKSGVPATHPDSLENSSQHSGLHTHEESSQTYTVIKQRPIPFFSSDYASHETYFPSGSPAQPVPEPASQLIPPPPSKPFQHGPDNGGEPARSGAAPWTSSTPSAPPTMATPSASEHSYAPPVSAPHYPSLFMQPQQGALPGPSNGLASAVGSASGSGLELDTHQSTEPAPFPSALPAKADPASPSAISALSGDFRPGPQGFYAEPASAAPHADNSGSVLHAAPPVAYQNHNIMLSYPHGHNNDRYRVLGPSPHSPESTASRIQPSYHEPLPLDQGLASAGPEPHGTAGHIQSSYHEPGPYDQATGGQITGLDTAGPYNSKADAHLHNSLQMSTVPKETHSQHNAASFAPQPAGDLGDASVPPPSTSVMATYAQGAWAEGSDIPPVGEFGVDGASPSSPPYSDGLWMQHSTLAQAQRDAAPSMRALMYTDHHEGSDSNEAASSILETSAEAAGHDRYPPGTTHPGASVPESWHATGPPPTPREPPFSHPASTNAAPYQGLPPPPPTGGAYHSSTFRQSSTMGISKSSEPSVPAPEFPSSLPQFMIPEPINHTAGAAGGSDGARSGEPNGLPVSSQPGDVGERTVGGLPSQTEAGPPEATKQGRGLFSQGFSNLWKKPFSLIAPPPATSCQSSQPSFMTASASADTTDTGAAGLGAAEPLDDAGGDCPGAAHAGGSGPGTKDIGGDDPGSATSSIQPSFFSANATSSAVYPYTATAEAVAVAAALSSSNQASSMATAAGAGDHGASSSSYQPHVGKSAATKTVTQDPASAASAHTSSTMHPFSLTSQPEPVTGVTSTSVDSSSKADEPGQLPEPAPPSTYFPPTSTYPPSLSTYPSPTSVSQAPANSSALNAVPSVGMPKYERPLSTSAWKPNTESSDPPPPSNSLGISRPSFLKGASNKGPDGSYSALDSTHKAPDSTYTAYDSSYKASDSTHSSHQPLHGAHKAPDSSYTAYDSSYKASDSTYSSHQPLEGAYKVPGSTYTAYDNSYKASDSTYISLQPLEGAYKVPGIAYTAYGSTDKAPGNTYPAHQPLEGAYKVPGSAYTAYGSTYKAPDNNYPAYKPLEGTYTTPSSSLVNNGGTSATPSLAPVPRKPASAVSADAAPGPPASSTDSPDGAAATKGSVFGTTSNYLSTYKAPTKSTWASSSTGDISSALPSRTPRSDTSFVPPSSSLPPAPPPATSYQHPPQPSYLESYLDNLLDNMNSSSATQDVATHAVAEDEQGQEERAIGEEGGEEVAGDEGEGQVGGSTPVVATSGRAQAQEDSESRAFTPIHRSESTMQFTVLQEHIDELTEQKLELLRGLAQQNRLAADLAEENSKANDRLNDQAKEFAELRKKVKQYELEMHAQALALQSMDMDRDSARAHISEASERSNLLASEVVALEQQLLNGKAAYNEASERSNLLASEVVALEQQLLNGKAAKLKLERKLEERDGQLERELEERGGQISRLERQVAAFQRDHKEHEEETAQMQLDKRNLVVKLKQTEARLEKQIQGGPHSPWLAGRSPEHVSASAPASAARPEVANQEVQCELQQEEEAAQQVSASSPTEGPEDFDGLGGELEEDLPSLARPMGGGDPPTAVLADLVLARFDAPSLFGTSKALAQLARWLPAGPVTSESPLSAIAEEEVRVINAVHVLLEEYESMYTTSVEQLEVLQATVTELRTSNAELRQRLGPETPEHTSGSVGGTGGLDMLRSHQPLAGDAKPSQASTAGVGQPVGQPYAQQVQAQAVSHAIAERMDQAFSHQPLASRAGYPGTSPPLSLSPQQASPPGGLGGVSARHAGLGVGSPTPHHLSQGGQPLQQLAAQEPAGIFAPGFNAAADHNAVASASASMRAHPTASFDPPYWATTGTLGTRAGNPTESAVSSTGAAAQAWPLTAATAAWPSVDKAAPSAAGPLAVSAAASAARNQAVQNYLQGDRNWSPPASPSVGKGAVGQGASKSRWGMGFLFRGGKKKQPPVRNELI